MMDELVQYHIQSAIRANVAELFGLHGTAERIRAQGNLRLVIMAEYQVRELAWQLVPPGEDIEPVYQKLIEKQKAQRESAGEWIGKIYRSPADSLNRN